MSLILTALEAIASRRTHSRLGEPGPDGSDLRRIREAASHAPDHGRCRPWRFIIVSPNVADDFGDVLATAYTRRCLTSGSEIDFAQRERERAKVYRAPVLIVVACQPKLDTKVPVHEQEAAVAAATQNLLIAATALGYGSKWSTGPAATDALVKRALGLDDPSRVMGFVYLGTLPNDHVRSLPPRAVDISDLVRTWRSAGSGPPSIALPS